MECIENAYCIISWHLLQEQDSQAGVKASWKETVSG